LSVGVGHSRASELRAFINQPYIDSRYRPACLIGYRSNNGSALSLRKDFEREGKREGQCQNKFAHQMVNVPHLGIENSSKVFQIFICQSDGDKIPGKILEYEEFGE